MGKMINFAHVNAHADFTAILNHYNLEFTQHGGQIRLLCPFHEDSKPSLSITLEDTDNAKANTFHCFGCHEKGSVIDFVSMMDSDNDLRACAESIATITGCSLAPAKSGRRKPVKPKDPKLAKKARTGRKRQNGQSGAEKSRDGNSDAPEKTSDVNHPLKFAFNLDEEHESVLQRLDPEAADFFGVGWLPDESKSMMSGRICIPIHNQTGDLVAYVGRWANEDVPDDEDKYLFPPKFNKMAELYNLHRLKNPKEIMLVEGFFSTMRLHQLGAPVAGVMGTAISDAQIELLRAKGVKRVWLVFDSDAGGLKARPAAVEALARSFFVRTVTLPDGGSPDDVSEKVLKKHLPFKLKNRF